MKPKFTDAKRYPNGYTPSHSTDIRKTLARALRERAAVKAEAQIKVTTLKRTA